MQGPGASPPGPALEQSAQPPPCPVLAQRPCVGRVSLLSSPAFCLLVEEGWVSQPGSGLCLTSCGTLASPSPLCVPQFPYLSGWWLGLLPSHRSPTPQQCGGRRLSDLTLIDLLWGGRPPAQVVSGARICHSLGAGGFVEEELSGLPEGRQAWQRPEGGGGGGLTAPSVLGSMELSRHGGWVGAWGLVSRGGQCRAAGRDCKG